jgi:hypothetical protein
VQRSHECEASRRTVLRRIFFASRTEFLSSRDSVGCDPRRGNARAVKERPANVRQHISQVALQFVTVTSSRSFAVRIFPFAFRTSSLGGFRVRLSRT